VKCKYWFGVARKRRSEGYRHLWSIRPDSEGKLSSPQQHMEVLHTACFTKSMLQVLRSCTRVPLLLELLEVQKLPRMSSLAITHSQLGSPLKKNARVADSADLAGDDRDNILGFAAGYSK
jgi:hypothetical protein